jgi:hypothetical protein
MSHERFSERILDLAYGELSPREAGKVEAHAASCAECGAELARIRGTRRLMAALPDERAPDRGERVLLAAAREEVRGRAPVRSWSRWMWSTSVVAALLLAVGAVSYRLLAMRPAAEREGEELLGRGQYAEAPPSPEPSREGVAKDDAQDEAKAETLDEARTEAPPATPAPQPEATARPRAEVAAPTRPKTRSPPSPDAEGKHAASAPARDVEAPAASPAARRAYAEAPAEATRAEDGDVASAAVGAEEEAGFAAPPERAPEAPSRSAVAAARPRSAGAPAAAPSAAPEREAAAESASPAAALDRYASLREDGVLAGEIRTFVGCEGEAWRKVETDRQGRVVKYVREGRIGGVRVRVEHLFDADGRLAVVRATDVERGAAVEPGELGLTLPRHAGEAGADAPPRCGR